MLRGRRGSSWVCARGGWCGRRTVSDFQQRFVQLELLRQQGHMVEHMLHEGVREQRAADRPPGRSRAPPRDRRHTLQLRLEPC